MIHWDKQILRIDELSRKATGKVLPSRKWRASKGSVGRLLQLLGDGISSAVSSGDLREARSLASTYADLARSYHELPVTGKSKAASARASDLLDPSVSDDEITRRWMEIADASR